MKKSLALLAGAGVLLTAIPSVHAQDATTAPATGAASGPFADVPADHWAYGAVKTLQDAHIVIGYPDATYGGRRPMTRYEFATAIARLLPMINGNYATKDDLSKVQSDLESKLADNQKALDALSALVNEFRPELEKLGQDVAAIQKRLDNLEGRVAALEAENERIKFHVTTNLIARADGSKHRDANKDYLGYFDKNGTGQPGTAASGRILEDTAVYHDILLNIRGKVSDTSTVNIDLDYGNYLNSLRNAAVAGSGFATGTGPGSGGNSEGSTDSTVNVYQAYLDSPVQLGPLGGAELKFGRFGTQFTKWTLKQQDADIYTNLFQTDSGNQLIDGAQLNLKLGPFATQAFAGKFGNNQFFQPTVGPGGFIFGDGFERVGAETIKQGAGVRFVLGAPEGFTLGASVAQYAFGNTIRDTSVGASGAVLSPDNGKPYNRVSVYGLDAQGALPFGKKIGLNFSGSYNVSALGANSGFNSVGNKFRYQQHEEIFGFNLGKVALTAGYQYVGPNYSAPGYWNKIGNITNLTNIAGPVYSAKYSFSPKLALNADYEQYKVAYDQSENGAIDYGTNHDHINRYQVGFTYGLSSSYGVDLGYEKVDFDLRGYDRGPGRTFTASKPNQGFLTLGIGHSFNPNASFKLVYQIETYKTDAPEGEKSLAGNTAVGQFQLKF